MNDLFYGIFEWIREDWKSSPLRFIIEILAWAISIGCSLAVALTVPNPPWLVLYPLWITGCAMYTWAAYTRQSFGMLLNYLLLIMIDTVGLIRVLLIELY